MNFSELRNIEKAFQQFLKQLNRKTEVKIEYYQYEGSRGRSDNSFVGYTTSKNGLHGIHYNITRKSFLFGTRDGDGDTWLTTLTLPQENDIPKGLRDALKEVARTRLRMVFKKKKHNNDNLNEWI